MNSAAMITQLGVRWRDPTFVVRTRPTWLDYLNKAYRKFVKRSRFPMSSGYSDIAFAAGDASKPLPSDVWGILSAYDTTNGQPLYPLYSRDQRAHIFAGQGPVEAFAVEDNDLYLFATPREAVTIRVLGSAVLADLTDAGGSTPVIPGHYHHSLMDGALELSFRDDQNAELAQVYKSDFDEAISDALREFTKPRGGKLVPLRNDYFETGTTPFRRGG